MLDDAPGDFLEADRQVDLTLRLGINSHVEQGDGRAPSLCVLADLFVGNGARDVTQQVPGLFGAEVEVSLLAERVDGSGLAIKPVHAPLFGALCEEGLQPLEQLVPAKARVYYGLSGFSDRRMGMLERQGQVPYELAL
jgi:hypothetical protein